MIRYCSENYGQKRKASHHQRVNRSLIHGFVFVKHAFLIAYHTETHEVIDVMSNLCLHCSCYFSADGSAAFKTEAPDTITSWVATALSVNPTSGLGISDAPAQVFIMKILLI